MLPDRLTRLLTAYIDGEASASQQQAVQSLLERSPDARTLFEQLQEDAARLRRLPRHQLDAEFPNRVLRAIAERRPRQPRRLAGLGLAPYPAWLGAAVAAGVLVVVGFGSFLYVEVTRRLASDPAVQKEEPAQPRPEEPLPVAPKVVEARQPDQVPEDDIQPMGPVPSPRNVARSEDAEPPAKPRAPRKPAPPARTELAVPTPQTEGLEAVRPGIGLSLAVRDLDQAPLRDRFRHELRRENTFRMELFWLGTGKAQERLRNAFKAAGVRLVIEPEASARLKSHRRGDYVLYTEALTADEVAKILEHLGRADKQAEAKRRGDGQFDQLFLWPFNPTDRKEFATLLGFDPFQAPPPRPKAPLGVDIRKPVADGTAAQVAQSLAGQGTPRPEPGKATAPKAPERLALLVPYVPNRARPPASKEVKQFIDNRKERQPGTVQLFLVLREAAG